MRRCVRLGLVCFAGVLLAGPSAAIAVDLDASLRAALAGAGMRNPLRLELQRPIDPRLLKLESQGIEASGLFQGKTHRARNAREVRALSGKLNPGDQLVLTGADWVDARFSFMGRGTAESPILVRPESPGAAVFSGQAEVTFHGSHLVITGLEFKGVVVRKSGDTIFRLGSGREHPADNSIVNRIKIENCNWPNRADWPAVRVFYMTINGRDNTVANSTFSDLQHFGQMLAAQDLPPAGLQRLQILNNRFINRPKLDDQNGYEIIQIGWSGEKARSAGSLIQGNRFERCDGENETITLKASDIVVRNNTFAGCRGVLCLREADRVCVQGNLFDGQGRRNTGGVRIAGADHVIVGNTFRDLTSPANHYYWPISMMCADMETSGSSIGYGRVKNILIAGNRFERDDRRIVVGVAPRPQYPLLPQNIRVLENVFTGPAAGGPFDHVAPDPTNALPAELHASGNRFLP